MLLDLDMLIFLFCIYLAMWVIDFLRLVVLEERYSNNLWREMGWKLLSHNSGSVGWSGLYSNWILMTSSLLTQGGLEIFRASALFETCWESYSRTGLIAILTWWDSWYWSLYKSWELLVGSLSSSLRKLFCISILLW